MGIKKHWNTPCILNHGLILRKIPYIFQHQVNCVCDTTAPKNSQPRRWQHVLCHHIGRVVICNHLYHIFLINLVNAILNPLKNIWSRMWLIRVLYWLDEACALLTMHTQFITFLWSLSVNPSVFFLGRLLLAEVNVHCLKAFLNRGTRNWYWIGLL